MEVEDPTNFDAMRAKVASSSIREECVQAHAVSGEVVPNGKVHHTEPCSIGVSKDGSDQSAVLAEGKPSNIEPQGECQGAITSEKNVPDYSLFPLSRGFCLSLVRALDSFEAAYFYFLAFWLSSCQPLPIYTFTALLFYFRSIFAIRSFVVPRANYPGRLIFASGPRGPSKFPDMSPKSLVITELNLKEPNMFHHASQ